LGDDEAAKLDIGEGLGTEDSDGNQVFALGSVRGGNLRDDTKIVDRAGAIAVKDEDGKGHGRLLGGIVEASDAARGGLDFANEVCGGKAVCGNNESSSAEGFTTGEGQFVFVECVDTRVETNGPRGEFLSKLDGDSAHAVGRNANASFGKHFENKFEHAAGSVEFAIEENATEERAEEAMDYFLGEAFGLQGVFGGAVRPAKDFVGGGIAEPAAESSDAELVGEGTKIGLQGVLPGARRAPWIDEFVHAASKPGERTVGEGP